ncbi:Crp/Fnr family transcriptional regulator [Brevundimonas sp.]
MILALENPGTFRAPSERHDSNALLDRLDSGDRSALLALATRENISQGDVLCATGQTPDALWLPVSACIAEYRRHPDGRALRVAITGQESASPIPSVLAEQTSATSTVCFSHGVAIRLASEHLTTLVSQRPCLLRSLLALSARQTAAAHQLAFCNAFHSVDQRVARWILETAYSLGSRILRTTQEAVALDLGVQRTSIVVAFKGLKAAQLVRHTRGDLRICDPDGLRYKSCGCEVLLTTDDDRRSALGAVGG